MIGQKLLRLLGSSGLTGSWFAGLVITAAEFHHAKSYTFLEHSLCRWLQICKVFEHPCLCPYPFVQIVATGSEERIAVTDSVVTVAASTVVAIAISCGFQLGGRSCNQLVCSHLACWNICKSDCLDHLLGHPGLHLDRLYHHDGLLSAMVDSMATSGCH